MVVDREGRRFGVSGPMSDERSYWVVLSRVACWATHGVNGGGRPDSDEVGVLGCSGELAASRGRSKSMNDEGGLHRKCRKGCEFAWRTCLLAHGLTIQRRAEHVCRRRETE